MSSRLGNRPSGRPGARFHLKQVIGQRGTVAGDPHDGIGWAQVLQRDGAATGQGRKRGTDLALEQIILSNSRGERSGNAAAQRRAGDLAAEVFNQRAQDQGLTARLSCLHKVRCMTRGFGKG